jgi:hypothetical protein
MDHAAWGYDFASDMSVETMLAAFNSGGPWQWTMGDSDIFGFYVRCQPKERAKIRVYEARQFCTPWQGDCIGDREGFCAELMCDDEDRAQIDRDFLTLLRGIEARNISVS